MTWTEFLLSNANVPNCSTIVQYVTSDNNAKKKMWEKGVLDKNILNFIAIYMGKAMSDNTFSEM